MTDSIQPESTEIEGYEHEDRLSQLPDDILMHILDNFKVLSDAVRTCVLSKRWTRLLGLHSTIVLDIRHYLDKVLGDEFTVQDIRQANLSIVEATKSILAHKSQHTITNLSISFLLRDESIDIVRSVGNVMENRDILEAEFKMIPENFDSPDDDMLNYGRRLMTFIDSCPRAFGVLTDLHLHTITFCQSDFYNVLGTCEKLKYLSLKNCQAETFELQIEHSQLVELVINSCSLEKVELKWLPKLKYLTCRNWLFSKDKYPLSFGHIPELWKVNLGLSASILHKTLVLSEFLTNAVIGELYLDFILERIWIQPEAPVLLASKLKNLQVVKLGYIHDECDLTWTMFILEAAPRLKDLHVHVQGHVCKDLIEDDPFQKFYQKASDSSLNWELHDDFKHYNLRKLIIKGFQAEEKFTRYARRVMKVAVNLETVLLLGRHQCTRCKVYPSTYPRTDEERDLIRKQISEIKSSSIKFEN